MKYKCLRRGINSDVASFKQKRFGPTDLKSDGGEVFKRCLRLYTEAQEML